MRRLPQFYKSIFFLLLIFAIFISCSTQDESFSVKKWEEQIIKQREQKDKEFATSPDSPFAGLNRLVAEANKESYLFFFDGNFILSDQEKGSAMLAFFQKDDQWNWKTLKGNFTFRSGKKELTDGIFPSGRVTGSFDRFTFNLYPLADKLVVIIFDPERKAIKEFKHLVYFPPNDDYRVIAKLKKFETFEKIEMVTSRNLIKTFFRYAEVSFAINGQKKSLMAYKSDVSKNKWLFIPFKDMTSEVKTYAAGRFLEIIEPAGNEFILDFNLAFNPLCNYADVYNCSYPPRENSLDIAINAGEKTYPIDH